MSRPFRLAVFLPPLLCLLGGSRLSAQDTFTEALDAPALAWTPGGKLEWATVAREDAGKGASVAELGVRKPPGLGSNPRDTLSWLETVAEGPGVFMIDVRHNSNPHTRMSMSVDGVEADNMWHFTDETPALEMSGWRRLTVPLPPGSHTVRVEHRFYPSSVPDFAGQVVQLDNARLVPPLGPEILDAIDVPADGTWIAGGGTELRLRRDGAHDGVDYLLADDGDESLGYLDKRLGWLQKEVTGPATLSWRMLYHEGEWAQHHTFIPPGVRAARWVNNFYPLSLDDFHEVPAPEVSLTEAMDAEGLIFAQGGAAPWRGARTLAAPDSVDAAWTEVKPGEESWVQTEIEGPASLTFQNAGNFLSPEAWESSVGLRFSVSDRSLQVYESSSVLLPPGRHTVRWSAKGSLPYDVYGWQDRASSQKAVMMLDQVRSGPATLTSLAQALDAPDLTWSTSAGKEWLGLATEAAPDGADAAVPPFLKTGESAWLETTVRGPGKLRFRWPVGEDAGHAQCGVSLLIDGGSVIRQGQGQLTPELELGEGPHTLRWVAEGIPELRFPLLDQVSWTPSPAASPSPDIGDSPAFRYLSNVEFFSTVEEGGHQALRLGTPAGGVEFGVACALGFPGPGFLQGWARSTPNASFSIDRNYFSEGSEWAPFRVFVRPGLSPVVWNYSGYPYPAIPDPAIFLSRLRFEPSSPVSLAEALGYYGPWRSSPAMPWAGVEGGAGPNAYRSALSGGGASFAPGWLETEFTGPALLTFLVTGEGTSWGLSPGGSRQPWTEEPFAPNPARRGLHIPEGAHTVRWEDTKGDASLAEVRVLPLPGGLSVMQPPSGTHLLLRVPRPQGFSDEDISLEHAAAPNPPWWNRIWSPVIESTDAAGITFRVYPVNFGVRQFYRAVFIIK